MSFDVENYFFAFISLMIAWSALSIRALHLSEIRCADARAETPARYPRPTDSSYHSLFQLIQCLGFLNLMVAIAVLMIKGARKISPANETVSACEKISDAVAKTNCESNAQIMSQSSDYLASLLFIYIIVNLCIIFAGWAYRHYNAFFKNVTIGIRRGLASGGGK